MDFDDTILIFNAVVEVAWSRAVVLFPLLFDGSESCSADPPIQEFKTEKDTCRILNAVLQESS